jgi:hypothetical protein
LNKLIAICNPVHSFQFLNGLVIEWPVTIEIDHSSTGLVWYSDPPLLKNKENLSVKTFFTSLSGHVLFDVKKVFFS